MSNRKIKCECQSDHESGDFVTVHKKCGREFYAVGRRPVMDKNGPSYTYQGEDWICVGGGTIESVKTDYETLTSTAIVKLD